MQQKYLWDVEIPFRQISVIVLGSLGFDHIFVMEIAWSAASFIILISVVVTVHELGHLVIARMNGVLVEAFSVGMGPVLFEHKGKSGILWRFSLLPIGGYVKMFGESGSASADEKMPEGYTEADAERLSIHHKKPWQKLLVFGAGPVANLIFAVIVSFTLMATKGVQMSDSRIVSVVEGSAAQQAGLQGGDVILEVNGVQPGSDVGLKEQLLLSAGKIVDLTVKSGDKLSNVQIKMFDEKNGEIQPVQTIGVMIEPINVRYEKIGVADALRAATAMTYTVVAANVKAICKLVTEAGSVKNLRGLISIAKMSADSAKNGFGSFVLMLATISALLGAVNLLPIPILDGGHMAISAIEWLTGWQMSKGLIQGISIVGLAIVLAMMSIGLLNDLSSCKLFAWKWSLFK